MYKMIKTLFAVFALLCTFSAVSAADGRIEFKQIEVKTTFTVPPEVKAGGVKLVSNAAQPQNRWLMIAVQFVPDVKLPDRVRNLSRAAQHQLFWADNVTMKVRVLLESASTARGGGYCMFTGRSDFWHVHLNNKRHAVQMFLPASMIDRHHIPQQRSATRTRRNSRGGSAINSDSLINRAKDNDFKVEVIFSVGGQEIARGYCNVSGSGRRQAAAFKQLMSRVPEGRIYDGAVLSKGQSPWAFYNVNHYDPEKSVVPVK